MTREQGHSREPRQRAGRRVLARCAALLHPGRGLHRTCGPCTRSAAGEADTFYRDRWCHDKVVRSTHGVNCTGSCSWKVYVKDGIITWESQQTDYPSRRPGPARSTSRAAAPAARRSPGTRTRRPGCATRTRAGVLLEMYREAKARLGGDPVPRGPTSRPTRSGAGRYQRARGKGGLVRVVWDEAMEIIAAAHVHTIKEYGPDRVAGFSPIPAMSMVSHAVGARFSR